MFTCGIKPFIEALKEDLTGNKYIILCGIILNYIKGSI